VSALDWVTAPAALPSEGRSVSFRLRDHALLLCNVGGAPYVVEDRCSHAGTSLAGGRLRGFVLECPLHGGKIDVRDGSPAAAPIRRPVRAWPARLTHDGAVEVGFTATATPH